MPDNRWPEPRPSLSVPVPSAPPGTAWPHAGRLAAELPVEVSWLLLADIDTARSLSGELAMELTLKLQGPAGPRTRARLLLRLHRKPDRVVLASFTHIFEPQRREALVPLARLGRQLWWHLVVVRPDGRVPKTVEVPNTLGLPELLRATLR